MNRDRRVLHSRLLLIGIACLSLLASAKAADGKPNPKVQTNSFRLGREFNIRLGREVTLRRDNLRIKFAEVVEDSRCPKDVECVWAGNATVRLEVSLHGRNRKSLVLNTNGKPTLIRDARYRGYKVTLIGLEPYPVSKRPIPRRDNVVTLLVSND